jgi:hypothetical protein
MIYKKKDFEPSPKKFFRSVSQVERSLFVTRRTGVMNDGGRSSFEIVFLVKWRRIPHLTVNLIIFYISIEYVLYICMDFNSA